MRLGGSQIRCLYITKNITATSTLVVVSASKVIYIRTYYK